MTYQCVSKWRHLCNAIAPRIQVELWQALDAVSKPPPPSVSFADLVPDEYADHTHNFWHNWLTSLAVPTNNRLEGLNYSYFPRGGPKPSELERTPKRKNGSETVVNWQASSRWCGMTAGENMLYAAQIVDGRVRMESGPNLQKELDHVYDLHASSSPAFEFADGSTVVTPAFGRLKSDLGFMFLCHTVTPFYLPSSSEASLRACYESVIDYCLSLGPTPVMLILPLLGAGARGFPISLAATVCADALSSALTWRQPTNIRFSTFSPSSSTLKVPTRTLSTALPQLLIRCVSIDEETCGFWQAALEDKLSSSMMVQL